MSDEGATHSLRARVIGFRSLTSVFGCPASMSDDVARRCSAERARGRRANQYEAIRAIRAGIDSGSSFASLLTEDFLHKLRDMLNASSRRAFWSCAPRARDDIHGRRQKIRSNKTPYVAGVFNESEKFARGGARSRRAMSRAPPAFVETQHGVSARGPTCCIKRKCWFFCRAVVIRMQCSRSCGHSHDYATHSG